MCLKSIDIVRCAKYWQRKKFHVAASRSYEASNIENVLLCSLMRLFSHSPRRGLSLHLLFVNALHKCFILHVQFQRQRQRASIVRSYERNQNDIKKMYLAESDDMKNIFSFNLSLASAATFAVVLGFGSQMIDRLHTKWWRWRTTTETTETSWTDPADYTYWRWQAAKSS